MTIASNAKVDLNDVGLFVEVVRAASFTGAAKARSVPVSTVSRRIARLERDVGMLLLERTTRKLRLTDGGRSYFEHAERALDELSAGADILRERQAAPRGHVRITAPIGLGTSLGAALAPYVAANPHVTVEVELTDRRVDFFEEGFDIAFRVGSSDSPDFIAKPLFGSIERGLFASKAYLKRRGRPKTIADLHKHDLVATRAAGGRATWELGPKGRRPRRLTFTPRLVLNELWSARAAAVAGAGITFLPASHDTERALERVLPEVTGVPASMFMLYPARRILTAAVRSCVDHLFASLAR